MRRGLVLLMALCLLAPALPVSAGAESRETRAKLEEVRKKIEELRSALSGARDSQTRLREQLRSSEIAIGEANRALRDLERRQRVKNDELRTLRQRQGAARKELARHQELLQEQVIASYAIGHQGHLKLILSQQDPATLGRMLAYYNYFHRARAGQIAAVSDSLREIETLEQAITRESEALERLHAEQSKQLSALESSRVSRGEVLAKLVAEIQTREQALETLLQDERSLSELVRKLREALAAEPVEPTDLAPFASLKGRLPMPVNGRVVARFGTQRRGASLPWRGVVIAASEGSEVRAIHGGRVVFADWMRGFGLLTIIDHGKGYMSLYGYNQSLYKNVGDHVRQGEVIATVGDSGGRDSPGLYFEIRHDGKPDNPLLWCRADVR
jgi:murein hydrolase activator